MGLRMPLPTGTSPWYVMMEIAAAHASVPLRDMLAHFGNEVLS